MHCERCEELAEEVRQLREMMAGTKDEIFAVQNEFGLRTQEARLFMALHKRQETFVDIERLIYFMLDNPGSVSDAHKLLHVVIHRVRKKIASKYVILNMWRRSYKLERINHDTSHVFTDTEQAAQSQA